MRDDVVELIETDPDAFDAFPSRSSAAGARSGRGRKLIALAIAAGTALGTAALFSSQPWAGPGPRLEFGDTTPATSKLSDHLLLDLPVNQIRATTLHTQAAPDSRSLTASGAVGYFFGDKGATFAPADGPDRWFGFYATPAGAPDAPSIDNATDTIAGVPGSYASGDGGVSQLTWGPLNGYMYTAAASNLSKNEILSLTDQLRVQNGKVVILNHAALGTLQPIGRFADYYALIEMMQRAQQNGVHIDGVVGVFYNTGGSIASMPANKTIADVSPFVFANKATPPTISTVHGHTAYGFKKGGGQVPANVVLWWEGGRVVLVSSDGTLDQTFALAQTAHVATEADWAAAGAVD